MQKLSSIDYPKSFPPWAFYVEPEEVQIAQKLALQQLIQTNVVELKSPSEKMFSRDQAGNIFLSGGANRGVCQLLQYVDYCSAAQSYLRDTLNLKGFKEPKGFLIVGREAELSNDIDAQELNRAFNELMTPRIEVRSFDALVRSDATTWVTEGVIVNEI